MGTVSAMGMVEEAGVNETTVTWHLRHNHFPPHPTYMVPIAMDAIAAYNDGEFDKEIKLPAEVHFRGYSEVEAWQIIDGLNLQSFCNHEVEL
jgi:hypothetical protein